MLVFLYVLLLVASSTIIVVAVVQCLLFILQGKKNEHLAALPASLEHFSNFLGDRSWFDGETVSIVLFIEYRWLWQYGIITVLVNIESIYYITKKQYGYSEGSPSGMNQ